MKRFAFFILFLLVTTKLLAVDAVETLQNGIKVHPKTGAAKTIEINVINSQIIRVQASPQNKIPQVKSLCVLPGLQSNAAFKVTQNASFAQLSTQDITVKISLVSGQISFTDRAGKVLLQETKRTFSPIAVDNDKGYTFQQVFTGIPGEAIYGLGQHQSDDFNYKHKSEDLFQYNTKVSVPFIMSTKNYGILWDNYSQSKYGDPRDYKDLNQFTLFNKNGKQGALTATYTNKGSAAIVRQESAIDYENLTTVKKFPVNFNFNNGAVVWEGSILPNNTDIYKFSLYYAGYTKVWLDGKLVVPERWRTSWNPNTFRFSFPLTKGKRSKIKLEWKPDGGVSYVGLKALSSSPIEKNGNISFWSEMGDKMDYYFVAGKNMDEVISGYRTLTGKASIMPIWAMGFWQSRERYKTQDELLNVVNEYRKRKIPLDNIVLDWSYWPENAWGSHQFDLKRFPDAKGMVDSVHQENAHIMISVWPKFYTTTKHFKQFSDKGWMYMQAVQDSIRDWIGEGYVGSFYDAYNPDAQKLFWKQMKDNLYVKGIDAWWMDASEPNIRDCTDMDYRKKLCGPTALGSSTKYFNAYALMNANAIYNGQREADHNKRVFLLTRSGFAGLQRYSTATWSGDIASRWEDLKAQIPAGLNFAMSGIPFWTMDIGGFCVEKRYGDSQLLFDKTGKETEDLKEWRELNLRWFQFGAFCPLFRSHGQFPYREIYNLAPEGHPVYKSLVYYDELRYRLMPYIYSLAGMAYHKDYTLMRSLAMDYAADQKTYTISDQFLFGSGLMVSPVYNYKARSREVYFPAGNPWYDFYSGKQIEGGRKLSIEAPLERIPLFVPGGAILPVGEVMQYSSEKKADDIEIRVYKGKDGKFSLYEDEGNNYDYEKGAFSTIDFEYLNDQDKLTIHKRKGSFNGMLSNRTFRIVIIGKNNKQEQVVRYNGNEIAIKF
ncbi:alpha-D-xyloside xylohydrolase [Pedobacter suwonensis]|uniref:Alpha-D-xyloside xylohydrolase n=1 Tax=Pedobacter suwonensis TaxID=332999 RepID=A0A1I0SN68_9SPHI|nr:TIM-barrel domain-containing protein [Pedobacter suwonensis]SFA40974.1 alpha-D-xyloside xylohydrolase [Pedobacter suwonensis]